jgi:hypothetical protein
LGAASRSRMRLTRSRYGPGFVLGLRRPVARLARRSSRSEFAHLGRRAYLPDVWPWWNLGGRYPRSSPPPGARPSPESWRGGSRQPPAGLARADDGRPGCRSAGTTRSRPDFSGNVFCKLFTTFSARPRHNSRRVNHFGEEPRKGEPPDRSIAPSSTPAPHRNSDEDCRSDRLSPASARKMFSRSRW